MHLRFTVCQGTPVIDEQDHDHLGEIADILIDADTGKIEGFFVHSGGHMLVLSPLDVRHWGTSVHVRSSDVLAPPEDLIRLQTLMDDSRAFIGQRIRTEAGRRLGVCGDVQFSTESWHIEWLFPRKWFRWGIALPITEVLEVTPAAIIVRDPLKSKKEPVQEEKESVIEEIVEIAEQGVAKPTTRTAQDS